MQSIGVEFDSESGLASHSEPGPDLESDSESESDLESDSESSFEFESGSEPDVEFAFEFNSGFGCESALGSEFESEAEFDPESGCESDPESGFDSESDYEFAFSLILSLRLRNSNQIDLPPPTLYGSQWILCLKGPLSPREGAEFMISEHFNTLFLRESVYSVILGNLLERYGGRKRVQRSKPCFTMQIQRFLGSAQPARGCGIHAFGAF